MSRVPIRLRLTLAFALAMTIVLAGIGSFLVYRLGTSLEEAVNEGLQGRAEEFAPRVARATGEVGSLDRPGYRRSARWLGRRGEPPDRGC